MKANTKRLPALKLLKAENGWVLRNEMLSAFAQEYFNGRKEAIQVLEAGCGQRWQLDLGDIRYQLTGVDICEDALNNRLTVEGDLDRSICGDLCTLVLNPQSFDMIYCVDVVEHINGAEQVFKNFFDWLRPDGILAIVFPDRASVFGFLTRMLPFWFHIFYYKYMMGMPNAGRPGFSPFPTYYDDITSRNAIHEYCLRCGHQIALEYGRPFNMRKFGYLAWAASSLCRMIHLLSFGRLADDHCSLVYVIRKGVP